MIAGLSPRGRRFLTAVITAILVAGALQILRTMTWTLQDLQAYRDAADRLASGQALYPAVADQNAPEVYRYAPWFAMLWVPLRGVPDSVMEPIWGLVLIGAGIAAAWPLLASRNPLRIGLGLVGAAWLIGSAKGNVEPLMVAWLVHGVERRSGPLWIALAASLKATPLAFSLVYLGRRQWLRFAVALGLTGLLVLPAVAMGIGSYPTQTLAYVSIPGLIGPVLWIVLLVGAAALTLRLAVTRWGWLSAAAASVFAFPTLPLYHLSLLLVGSPSAGRNRSSEPSRTTASNSA